VCSPCPRPLGNFGRAPHRQCRWTPPTLREENRLMNGSWCSRICKGSSIILQTHQ
jgi:hypothetical protein